MGKRYATDFLFPRSSWLTGAGSIWNLSGLYYIYNESSSPEEADRKALASDWGMVGQDMQAALEKMKSEFAKVK